MTARDLHGFEPPVATPELAISVMWHPRWGEVYANCLALVCQALGDDVLMKASPD